MTSAQFRTESVNNKVPSKKSAWKVKKIRGNFGKIQMAASIRILRISASYSTQRLLRISDWRISGLILENWQKIVLVNITQQKSVVCTVEIFTV